jgi:hypothetical protein
MSGFGRRTRRLTRSIGDWIANACVSGESAGEAVPALNAAKATMRPAFFMLVVLSSCGLTVVCLKSDGWPFGVYCIDRG